MTIDEINKELVTACRRAYAESSGTPVLDLFAFALGYELATPGDTERRGSVFIQHVMTILAWGIDLDDAQVALLAGSSVTPAYIPGNHTQNRYAVKRNGGKDVLVLADALTHAEAEAIDLGRREIERLGLWNAPDLAPVRLTTGRTENGRNRKIHEGSRWVAL